MPNSPFRILNFDNSVAKQHKLISSYNAEILDFMDIGPRARHWLDAKTRDCVLEKIKGSCAGVITFLGSGDFHHISSLLVRQFQQPLSVIVFDNHPDWDVFPPKSGCGSWVSRVIEMPNVLKVISLGVSSGDISTFWIQTGNLNSLNSGRLELYPYSHAPTKALFRGRFKEIRWQELKNTDLTGLISGIIDKLPVKQAYISIDKDCLKSRYSLSNWEEGNLELDDLLVMLKLLRNELDIVGLDIAGDYSQVRVAGILKKICSYLDHPKNYTARDASADLITSVNEATNIKILEALKS